MPFDYGLRLNNRQRITNAKPIEANENQSFDGAEGLFLRSGSPQNVLLPQRQNFRLERRPRPKQIYDRPNNEPDKISHPVTASPDSRSTASQIEFATGTTVSLAAPQAASSRVSRYSRTDRRVLAMASQSTSSDPAAERCLLASAAIRLASTAKAVPSTNPSAMQRRTTVSNSFRSRSQSRKRPCLFLEKVEWSGTSPSRPSRQNQR